MKVDIRLDSGVDVDLDHITGPIPLDGGPGWTVQEIRHNGVWFVRGDGKRKWVCRKDPNRPSVMGDLSLDKS